MNVPPAGCSARPSRPACSSRPARSAEPPRSPAAAWARMSENGPQRRQAHRSPAPRLRRPQPSSHDAGPAPSPARHRRGPGRARADASESSPPASDSVAPEQGSACRSRQRFRAAGPRPHNGFAGSWLHLPRPAHHIHVHAAGEPEPAHPVRDKLYPGPFESRQRGSEREIGNSTREVQSPPSCRFQQRAHTASS